MPNRSATHIGDGAPARVVEQFQRAWPGLEVTFQTDDIRRPTDWRIHDSCHAVVVHLGGPMRSLETELDGFGGSCGPALPGEIWTVPAERRYASHACGGIIHYAVLLLDPAASDLLQGTREGRREIVPLAGVRDEFLHQGLRQLRTELQGIAKEANDTTELLAQSLAHTLGLYVGHTYAPGTPRPRRKPETRPALPADTARRLREFIADRLGERITLAELSTLAGMTSHQLLIAFRKAFGSTPGQYVIRQRLRRAQRQLVGTKKDITTIALDAGFASHSHLSACFKQHLGCCPSAFRSRRRGD
ncbi:MAG: helix-turn-helix transcriptional regulator [Verrucomicrobiae bacterium]|nr:helix-turn-helix transcriptional regulator [Verrucomicrobiae bacterium]